MAIELTKKQIKSVEPVGTVDGNRIDLIITYGGLNILIEKKENPEILGSGSNAALAKFVVEKSCSDRKLKWHNEE